MSPVAAALALLLHALVGGALFWESPLKAEAAEEAIEFTVEIPPPPSEPSTPSAPAAQAAAQTPSPQPSPAPRLGLPPPRSLTPDPRATLAPEPPKQEPAKEEPEKKEAAQAEPPKEEPPKQEPAKEEPAKEEPQQQVAAAAPPPQQVQTPPPPPPGLRPSPLGQVPQQRAPGERQAAAQPSNPTFHNPADNYGEKHAREEYLRQVMRRISQFPYVPKNASTIREEGTVLTRVTIARDGRLLNVVLDRSSGLASLDAGVLDTIRRASPYAPLPALG